jgi:hypothetical protein
MLGPMEWAARVVPVVLLEMQVIKDTAILVTLE